MWAPRSNWICLALLIMVPAAGAQDVFQGVSRIVAVGDIHGDYDRLVDLLRSARLINETNAWIGGSAHFVLTGDFLDRGAKSRQVMDLLIELEPQACNAGGMVHALIGNHEAMNIYGDLRYVSPEEFESYRAEDSRELRDQAFATLLKDMLARHVPPRDVEEFRKDFEKQHPLGLVEHGMYFAADGKYGKWLRKKNAAVQINEALFIHGGISPKYAGRTLREINRSVREELDNLARLSGGTVQDPEGPLWYRGLTEASTHDKALTAHLDGVLESLRAKHMVIAHTPVPAILPRFGGRVIAIDVGLSRVYSGTSAFLIIEGDKYYAMHQGRRLDLPVASDSVIGYLLEAYAADPGNRRLGALSRSGDR